MHCACAIELNRLGTQCPQPLQPQRSYYGEPAIHPLRYAWAAMGQMGHLAAVVHLRREQHTAKTRRERRALLSAGCAWAQQLFFSVSEVQSTDKVRASVAKINDRRHRSVQEKKGRPARAV
jgi:hypothetical protein